MFISINQFSNDCMFELNFSHFMGKEIVIHKVLLMYTWCSIRHGVRNFSDCVLAPMMHVASLTSLLMLSVFQAIGRLCCSLSASKYCFVLVSALSAKQKLGAQELCQPGSSDREFSIQPLINWGIAFRHIITLPVFRVFAPEQGFQTHYWFCSYQWGTEEDMSIFFHLPPQ